MSVSGHPILTAVKSGGMLYIRNRKKNLKHDVHIGGSRNCHFLICHCLLIHDINIWNGVIIFEPHKTCFQIAGFWTVKFSEKERYYSAVLPSFFRHSFGHLGYTKYRSQGHSFEWKTTTTGQGMTCIPRLDLSEEFRGPRSRSYKWTRGDHFLLDA